MNEDDCASNASSEVEVDAMFDEPTNFRPPTPEPTTVEHTIGSHLLSLSLPPKHSLWAHKLWNAGKSLGKYINDNPSLVKGKRVVELGAAAAVPSLIACLCGAAKVSCFVCFVEWGWISSFVEWGGLLEGVDE